MATFILTNNPTRWRWEDHGYAQAVNETAQGRTVSDEWSVYRKRGIAPGDRGFILRQHDQRGIVASGTFVSNIYEAKHWDASGRLARFAALKFDRVLLPNARLPLEVLLVEIPDVAWRHIQGSGVQVSAAAEQQIERLWARH